MGCLTKSVMEQKFKSDSVLHRRYTVNGLCESFGITRTKGYKLIDRYYELGEEVLTVGLKHRDIARSGAYHWRLIGRGAPERAIRRKIRSSREDP